MSSVKEERTLLQRPTVHNVFVEIDFYQLSDIEEM